MTHDHSDFIPAFLILALFVVVGGIALVRYFQKLPSAEEPDREPALQLPAAPALLSLAPGANMNGPSEAPPASRCVCGELATERAPILVRERGSVLRDLLSMPPRYRRVVPAKGPRVYCESHAHVADAKLAEFVSASVRAAFSAAYAQVAVAAAAFEQEDLPRLVADSLTAEQKKALKRQQLQTSPIRALPRTGTDDASGGEPPAGAP